MKNKIILILCIAIIATTILSTTIAETVSLGNSKVHIELKAKQNGGGKTLQKLYDGDAIKIENTGEVWTKVLTEKGKTGYIRNTFIKGDNKWFASGTKYMSNAITGIITDKCNFRVGASTETKVLSVLNKGDKVTVYGTNGDYYLGFNTKKVPGFFKKTCFEKTGEKQNTTTTLPKMLQVSANSVNIRKGPGQKYKKLGKLKKGTYVALIAKGDKWSLIEYNNKQGYILNKYLKVVN